MKMNNTPAERFDELNRKRTSFIDRCERYSTYTIPKICLPDNHNQNSDEISNDYNSLGANVVNHLSNKLNLSLFSPSQPFFRLDVNNKMKQKFERMGIDETQIENTMAIAEKKATSELDRRNIRPKMYDAMKHIIITGNGLMIFEEEDIRIVGIKKFVVKRNNNSKLLELVLKETVNKKSLDEGILKELKGQFKKAEDQDEELDLYKWVKIRNDGDYIVDTWVNDNKLSDEYSGKYPLHKLPYKPITWDLASGDDYGTGLVEDYADDFEALRQMSRATIEGAILNSEFRWLVKPDSMTSPEDLEQTENGSVLPGNRDDVSLVSLGAGIDLQTNIAISQQYIERIGRGFLLNSAITRHAERVTAQEIRMNAEELENSLGGAYSRIAVDVQLPMAYWLMEVSDNKIDGEEIIPSVITGLQALSRSSDRDKIVQFISDMTQLTNLPKNILDRMRIGAIQREIASSYGLPSSKYLLSEEEYQEYQRQEMERMMAQQMLQNTKINGNEALDQAREYEDN